MTLPPDLPALDLSAPDLLPADLLCALETIPALAAWSPSSWQIDRLGGVTNRNYRLRQNVADVDYVLRLPGAGTSAYLNRPAGIHNGARAAAIGLAPAVVFSDAERGWQVSRYLPDCRSLTSADLREPETCQVIGHLLGRLQREAGTFQHELRPFTIADRYLDLAPEPQLLALRQQAQTVEQAIEYPGLPLVPAHIDPNPTNFLRRPDGAVYLIDWEFSAMADPCWDLAAIVLEGDLAAAASADLLQAAGHATDPAMLHRLNLFQCALCLVAASWAYVEIAAGNDSTDLRLFAEQRRSVFAKRLTSLNA